MAGHEDQDFPRWGNGPEGHGWGGGAGGTGVPGAPGLAAQPGPGGPQSAPGWQSQGWRPQDQGWPGGPEDQWAPGSAHGQTARGPHWGGPGPHDTPVTPPAPGPWGPMGPPPGPGTAQEAAPAHRRRSGLLIGSALVATALLAGGAGAGIAMALQSSSTTTASDLPTSQPVPSAGASNGTQGLNVPAIAARVEPAVVDITASGPNGTDEGTGMVLTPSGLVLTNNHVIAGSTTLSAQVNGAGKKYTATVVGADPTDDVALLQLHGGTGFKTVAIGDSSKVTVGTQVVAIGNALALAGPETVTDGIISATSRSIPVGDPSTGATEYLKGVFQTTAPINPGNSGGPLLNSYAQVIGMNTAAASSSGSNASASNVGFAIPINHAMAIARQIEAGKSSSTVFIGAHAIMGVTVENVACAEGREQGCYPLGSTGFGGLPFGYGTYNAPVSKGAVVAAVEQGSPAASAGIAVGDVITKVDGRSVANLTELSTIMQGEKVGKAVRVTWATTTGSTRTATLRLVAGPNV